MRATLVASILVLAGCEAAADPAPPPNHPLVDKLFAVHRRMHARFSASKRVEQAIAFGELDHARAEARTITKLEEPDVLPVWQPYFRAVEAAGADIAASRDLGAAARATARLGGLCASCHVAASAKIVFVDEPLPKTDAHLASQMATHQWAAARMWEGLIAPADVRWLDGARLLANAPIAITAESDQLGIADDVARMRLFAARALKAKPGERTALYGDLLATCAHCHATIRDP